MKSYFSTNRVLAWTITGVAVATIFFACKKEITTDTAPNNQSDNNAIAASQHEAAVSAMYGGIFETVGQVAVEQGLFTARKAGQPNTTTAVVTSCPVADLLDATNPDQWPKRVDIDFGESCKDKFGVYRSGVLHVTFSGPLFNANATIEVVPDGFKLDGKALEGKFIISAVTYSNTAGIQYTTEVTNGKVTLNDSTIVNYTSKRTIKQIAGFDQVAPLLNPADDVYTVEGTASISYEKGPVTGVAATFTTQEPLVKIDDCHHFVKGKLKIEFEKVTGVIDYGNGKCTDPTTITVGDKTKQIQL